MLDFEKASMKAATTSFPQANIKGCYFHLCQSLLRKVNSVGLKREFETDIDIKLKLKSLDALSFVPIPGVRSSFDKIAETFPNDEKFDDVLTYFFSTYIEGAAGRNPLFPIHIWNHFNAALERSPKTTNCCEGYHNALNSLFHCSHPSVWLLFDGLIRDAACHRLTVANVDAGRREIKKRRYEELHSVVASSVGKYHENYDIVKYLRTITNLY